MSAARIIGLVLTATGATLAIWFAGVLMQDGPKLWTHYLVAAIAGAMLSVGVRYVFRTGRRP